MVKPMGRPKTQKFERQIIIVDCTEAEAQQIREAIPDTRQRAEILLNFQPRKVGAIAKQEQAK